jgi:hypothetical protein
MWLAIVGSSSAICTAQTLFVIPTVSPKSASVIDTEPLRIALHVRDSVTLANVLRVEPPLTETGVLVYVLGGYPQIQGVIARSWLEATFLIDYRESSVVRLSAEFRKMLHDGSAAPTSPVDKLIRFVGGIIRQSHERGFDVASEVAVRRVGDCKQVSVLTVALARSIGIPARIVFGMALIRNGATFQGLGHSWTEVLVEGRWVVADAALIGPDISVRYLPFGVLENESMGYALDVARLTPIWIQRVEVLGSLSGQANVH